MDEVRLARRLLDLERLRPKLPASPRVEELIVEDYTDWQGADELLVWVVFRNGISDAERDWYQIKPIHRLIHETLASKGIKKYPYINFRTRSEYAQDRYSAS